MSPVPRQVRRPQWTLLILSLVIACCLVAIGVAFSIAVTGDEGQNLPEQIERVSPVKSGQPVPAQTQVFVDLLPGYEGVLVIDGLELETVSLDELQAEPGQQVTLPPTTVFEPGNATLTFTPSPEAPITEFTQGEHIVQVIFWKTIEGRAASSSYTWSFVVF